MVTCKIQNWDASVLISSVISKKYQPQTLQKMNRADLSFVPLHWNNRCCFNAHRQVHFPCYCFQAHSIRNASCQFGQVSRFPEECARSRPQSTVCTDPAWGAPSCPEGSLQLRAPSLPEELWQLRALSRPEGSLQPKAPSCPEGPRQLRAPSRPQGPQGSGPRPALRDPGAPAGLRPCGRGPARPSPQPPRRGKPSLLSVWRRRVPPRLTQQRGQSCSVQTAGASPAATHIPINITINISPCMRAEAAAPTVPSAPNNSATCHSAFP